MGKEIEKAWQATAQVLFGKSIGGLSQYEEWLKADVPATIIASSVVSGRQVYIPNFVFYAATQKQAMALDESLKWGAKHIGEAEVRGISLQNAASLLGDIRYFSSDVEVGTNIGMEECGIYFNCSFCLCSNSLVASKYCAYCMWPRNCEHVFGCAWIFSCSFCIKCYHSENLTRCFETSNSTNCSDCCFCHNCENVHDSMFCFNAKNLSHAIGNVEYSKEEYARIKKLVLAEIAVKVTKDKKLELSIYSIGAKK